MAAFTGQHAELIEQRHKRIFMGNMTRQESRFGRLFSREPSAKAYEDRLRVSGFGTFAVKPEGTPVAFDDPVTGTRRRTVHVTYALGYRLTMEMNDDEQHGIMDKMPADLGDAGADHQERIAWSLIDDGFGATGTYTGVDGEALFSTTHTSLRDGSTSSNSLNPARDVSTTGLEEILTMSRTQTSDEGRFVVTNPRLIVIHPDNEHKLRVELNTQQLTNSNNNDVSTVAQSLIGWDMISTPYKASTTNWSVHSPPGENSLIWYDRKKMEFSQAADPDTGDLKHYACYRASVETGEWRNNWGSNF